MTDATEGSIILHLQDVRRASNHCRGNWPRVGSRRSTKSPPSSSSCTQINESHIDDTCTDRAHAITWSSVVPCLIFRISETRSVSSRPLPRSSPTRRSPGRRRRRPFSMGALCRRRRRTAVRSGAVRIGRGVQDPRRTGSGGGCVPPCGRPGPRPAAGSGAPASPGRTNAAAASMRRLDAERTSPITRIRLLLAYVKVMLAAGDVPVARAAATELAELAATWMPPLGAHRDHGATRRAARRRTR